MCSFQNSQAELVLKYFDGKRDGVFIEAGAWDGEYLSNTLFLEVSDRLKLKDYDIHFIGE